MHGFSTHDSQQPRRLVDGPDQICANQYRVRYSGVHVMALRCRRVASHSLSGFDLERLLEAVACPAPRA